MSKVNFNYNGYDTTIQCKIGDKMCVCAFSNTKQDIWLISFLGIPEMRFTIPIHGIGVTSGKLYFNDDKHLYSFPLN